MERLHRQPVIVFALVAVSLALAGCGPASTPTAPSAQAPVPIVPSPPLTEPVYHTLSGLVFEETPEGQMPIEGVEVYCDSCGSPFGHTFVYTDALGVYSLSWASNGAHPLMIRKTGFDVREPSRTLPDGTGIQTAIVNGDTRFDIHLVRR